MGALEKRAVEVSNDFTALDVANTLWAYGSMGRTVPERVMEALEVTKTLLGGARAVHRGINNEIQECTTASEICALVSERAAEFNAVNVATAFRKVLLAPRTGVAPEDFHHAMHTLEGRGPPQHERIWSTTGCQYVPHHGQKKIPATKHVPFGGAGEEGG